MNFDLKSTEFWDPQATRKELLRVFDVCHGCRVCQTLCPSFVNLFQWIDDAFGSVDGLSEKQINDVIDQCYQCKLCYPICPYIPPHEWDIDYPRMMMRANMVRKKQNVATFGDKLLGNVDLVGTLSSYAAGMANWANRNPKVRALMEKYLGIHKDRLLPTFHSETFAKWFKKRRRAVIAAGGEKVVLFYTCTVNYNEPEIGKAAVAVMEKNGIDCQVPAQQCCGLPFLDSGQVDQAMKKIEANVASLSKLIRQGYKVVVPSASCSYMLKREYPLFLPTDDSRLVAENTYDLSEYLVHLNSQGKLVKNFTGDVGKIRYHQPCHLKAQDIGFKAQDLLKLIPGSEVKRMQCCSGHDGSWSVKKEFFEESMKVGKPLFKFMQADAEACTSTDCPLSAIQIQQGTGKKPVHPIVLMARAYGLDPDKSS
ncbi:MAG: anaerobic glycerol-3-phosphate dehydrogenase subunit C [Acidobacteria bacterium]|nr:anaerobic glycerol-3-phosphate dehydrogenase subunit C [Acidobacteriota bacterium]